MFNTVFKVTIIVAEGGGGENMQSGVFMDNIRLY